MENRTEIGKAIKSKLSDLDRNPSDFVWSKIEKDLDTKRNKRILAWFIPSIIAVALFSTLFYFNSDFQDKNKTQETQQQKNPKTEVSNSNPNPKSNPKLQKSGPDEITTIKKTKNVKLVKQSSKLVTSTNEYEEYEVVKKYKVIIKKEQITTIPLKSKEVKKVVKPIAEKTSKPQFKNSKTTKQKTQITNKSNKKNRTKKISTKPIITEVLTSSSIEKDTLTYKNTKNIPEEIKYKSDTIAKIDSLNLKKKTTPKREYKKRDYKVTETSLEPEYSVTAFYGPTIFGSLANQSTINSQLSDLPKKHPITSVYGFYFKTMYNKVGFRVGVSKINLKISTQLNSNEFIPSYNNIELNTDVSGTSLKNTFANSKEIDLIQKISFYEIPMEFNYAIKKDESKLNIEAFTGFSLLILDENNLSMRSENVSKQNIGHTKDISGANISYDLGLGFGYELNKKFEIVVNPLFKYYLSTFKENNDAKPYSFSLQTGLSYQF